MFVQTIEGRVADAEGLKRQFERWQQELKPGAVGYLGSTSGVTDDGTSISLVRFASEEEARRNSERREQGEWWAETAKYFDGDVTFRESSDVESQIGPGRDDAGFVQVMQGHCTDRARLRELEATMAQELQERRPDVIGDVRVWYGDSDFTMAVYFTSEAAAREGESKQSSAESEWSTLFEDLRYFDLRHPWLHSA